MCVVSCALMPFSTMPVGDDDALLARAPRYHPACPAHARPLDYGCDGPTRSVLLGRAGFSSEGSPVIAGSVPIRRFYVSTANQSLPAPRGYLAAELACGRVAPWSRRLGMSMAGWLAVDFDEPNTPQRRVHVPDRDAQQASGALHQRVATDAERLNVNAASQLLGRRGWSRGCV